MRWIPFLILVYLIVLFETTLGRVLTIATASLGTIGPDLTALVAEFVAFYVRTGPDAMLAAWALGMAVDLTTTGGLGSVTVVGPMSLAYALTAGVLFRLREAFFRERALTQALLAWAFCTIAHGLWVTAQTLLAGGEAGWGAYGRTMGQALAIACYSGLLMPLVHFSLGKCQRLFLHAPVGRGG